MSSQHSEIRNQALKNLRKSSQQRDSSQQLSATNLGDALLLALAQTGADLKSGPSLDEVKTLLVDVSRAARHPECGDGKCTAA